MLYLSATILLAFLTWRVSRRALFPELEESTPAQEPVTTTQDFAVRKWRSTWRWELYDLKEEVAREVLNHRHRDASSLLGGMPPRIMNHDAPFAAFGSSHAYFHRGL